MTGIVIASAAGGIIVVLILGALVNAVTRPRRRR
jgi:hypothetical protein